MQCCLSTWSHWRRFYDRSILHRKIMKHDMTEKEKEIMKLMEQSMVRVLQKFNEAIANGTVVRMSTAPITRKMRVLDDE